MARWRQEETTMHEDAKRERKIEREHDRKRQTPETKPDPAEEFEPTGLAGSRERELERWEEGTPEPPSTGGPGQGSPGRH
jgi:hypothetical protein